MDTPLFDNQKEAYRIRNKRQYGKINFKRLFHAFLLWHFY
jgi:hypothetical protein